jgi:hypothetical protein
MSREMQKRDQSYLLAQTAMAQLKAAVHMVLSQAPAEGLKNSDIGRALGIYPGHVKHEGHVPRTLLAIMEKEGVVVQNQKTKLWNLREIGDVPASEGAQTSD